MGKWNNILKSHLKRLKIKVDTQMIIVAKSICSVWVNAARGEIYAQIAKHFIFESEISRQ